MDSFDLAQDREKCRAVLGILHSVILNSVKDVSEKLSTSIFEVGIGREGSCERVYSFTLSAHTTLKIKARSSEE